MSARNELAGILAQWRQLTSAEGQAIQRANWKSVREIQTHKSDLKHSLAEAVRKCADEDAAGGARLTAFPFRAELGQIISMLNRNGELLAAQMRRARAEQAALDQAKRNLQRIQKSYVMFKPRATLSSYS